MNEEYAVNSANTGTPVSDQNAFPFLEMGTSFVIGLAIGYFMKKFFKILLLILGLGLVILFVMESQGVSTVNEQALENGVSAGVDSFKGLVTMLKDRLSSMNLSSGAGAVAGFFAGLKFG
ncbi:MAG: FUN14 domain-containing protein [Epsilonproteobacteria bacterium]|nr:FUN14 domain-containing protein [Campylobacterota bacterium]